MQGDNFNKTPHILCSFWPQFFTKIFTGKITLPMVLPVNQWYGKFLKFWSSLLIEATLSPIHLADQTDRTSNFSKSWLQLEDDFYNTHAADFCLLVTKGRRHIVEYLPICPCAIFAQGAKDAEVWDAETKILVSLCGNHRTIILFLAVLRTATDSNGARGNLAGNQTGTTSLQNDNIQLTGLQIC